MITVTPEAVELIRQSKEAQNIKDEVGVRLTAMAEGEFGPSYDIRFDLPAETDIKIGPEGSQLYVAPQTMKIMAGGTFDVVETPEGTAFKVINPNYVKEVSSGGSCCSSGGGCSSGGCGSHGASDDEGISGEEESGGCCSSGGCGC